MSAGVTEVFANLATTTMNQGSTLASGGTSLTVTSSSSFPSTGNFRIKIESEIILVTAVSSNTFTLVRGQEGTSAAAHVDGLAVTHVLTKGAIQAVQQARPVFTNTATTPYTMDSSGNPFDVLILHNKSGAVSYVMPAPTAGRHIELLDLTGAVNTLANNVFFIPNGAEKFNTSAGFALTGTNYNFTNGSGTVTATGSKFQSELAVGMSVQSSNQAGVNYRVTAIASDLSMTVSPTFGGSTTATATATRTSLTFAANGGRLFFDSDGTDWFVNGDGAPTILTYTASSGGTVAPFIPPQGVYAADFLMWGGGGGGGSGPTNSGAPTTSSAGGAGGAALAIEATVAVTPLSNNAVTVGAGGAGGAAVASSSNPGNAGSPGGDSSVGSLITSGGASGGAGGSEAGSVDAGGGLAVKQGNAGTTADNLYGVVDTTSLLATGTSVFSGIAQGGAGPLTQAGLPGARNPYGGFAAGTGGNKVTNSGGGGGGAAGPGGAGGNGSNGAVGLSSNGGDASANSGAGGGGSGYSASASGSGGRGGNGGSGRVQIRYVL